MKMFCALFEKTYHNLPYGLTNDVANIEYDPTMSP
jgi:hypothetical protein